ncbi:MAG: transporter substrate-binding domain-containing protein [Cellvibrio sp.]|nr:transporter substrate-binding domain-containing protein [Cellvibrio sp.]
MAFCRFIVWVSAFLFVGQVLAVEQAATPIIIPKMTSYDINHEDYYFSKLLDLALSKTLSTYGPYEIQEPVNWTADKRLRIALSKGEIDVLWSTTSAELEQEMLPIKISLLKEMNNYRVLIIRPEDQTAFSQVKNLKDLRKFRGGMNSQWVDAMVMEQNQLPQIYAVGYGKFFKMLAAKRFDYFSRGIYQVQTEVNFYPELKLAIERDLLLHYNNEFYFFVQKENAALASRIESGLKIALEDGSFDQLFNSIPRYQWALDELKNGARRVIDLSSPASSSEMPR